MLATTAVQVGKRSAPGTSSRARARTSLARRPRVRQRTRATSDVERVVEGRGRAPCEGRPEDELHEVGGKGEGERQVLPLPRDGANAEDAGPQVAEEALRRGQGQRRRGEGAHDDRSVRRASGSVEPARVNRSRRPPRRPRRAGLPRARRRRGSHRGCLGEPVRPEHQPAVALRRPDELLRLACLPVDQEQVCGARVVGHAARSCGSVTFCSKRGLGRWLRFPSLPSAPISGRLKRTRSSSSAPDVELQREAADHARRLGGLVVGDGLGAVQADLAVTALTSKTQWVRLARGEGSGAKPPGGGSASAARPPAPSATPTRTANERLRRMRRMVRGWSGARGAGSLLPRSRRTSSARRDHARGSSSSRSTMPRSPSTRRRSPGADGDGGAGDVDDGGDAVLARDDGGVRERPAELGHDRGRDQEERREARRRWCARPGSRPRSPRRGPPRPARARGRGPRPRRRWPAGRRGARPDAGGRTRGGGRPMKVGGGSGRAASRACSARRRRTTWPTSARPLRSAAIELVVGAEEDAAGGERGVDAAEAPVDVERDGADHPEHARDPGAHALAQAGEALRARSTSARMSAELHRRDPRLEPRHLAVGERARPGQGPLGIVGGARSADTSMAIDLGRILAPARRRELGLAHGAVAVRFEELSTARREGPAGRSARRGRGPRAWRSRAAGSARITSATLASARPGLALSSSRAPPTSACAIGSAAPQPVPGAPATGASLGSSPRADARRRPTRSSSRQRARWLASDADAQASISVPVRSSRSAAPRSVVARPSSGRRPRSRSRRPCRARSISASNAATSRSRRAWRASWRGAVKGSRSEEAAARHALDLPIERLDDRVVRAAAGGEQRPRREAGHLRGDLHEDAEVQVEAALHVAHEAGAPRHPAARARRTPRGSPCRRRRARSTR